MSVRKEGYEAQQLGFSLEDNPYPPGSDQFDSWKAGWLEREDKCYPE